MKSRPYLMPSPVILTTEGVQSHFPSSTAVVAYLKDLDWDIPESVLAFKQGVAERTLCGGEYLLYWDATSFLLAGAEAGLWGISFTLHEGKGGDC